MIYKHAFQPHQIQPIIYHAPPQPAPKVYTKQVTDLTPIFLCLIPLFLGIGALLGLSLDELGPQFDNNNNNINLNLTTTTGNGKLSHLSLRFYSLFAPNNWRLRITLLVIISIK